MALKVRRKKTCHNCVNYEPPEYICITENDKPKVSGHCLYFGTYLKPDTFRHFNMRGGCRTGYKRK